MSEAELAKWMLVFGQQEMIEALSVLKEADKIPIEIDSSFNYREKIEKDN